MASEKTITLNEVLHRIKAGERFDLEYVSADKKRGTGGQLKVLTACMITRLGKTQSAPGADKIEPVRGKAPRHYENGTLNIQILGTREVRKIHPRLITKFNGISLS